MMIMRRTDEPPTNLQCIFFAPFFRKKTFLSLNPKIFCQYQCILYGQNNHPSSGLLCVRLTLGSSVTSSRSEPRPFKWSAQINTRLRTGSADRSALLLSGFNLALYGFNAFLLNRDALIYALYDKCWHLAFAAQLLPFGYQPFCGK